MSRLNITIMDPDGTVTTDNPTDIGQPIEILPSLTTSSNNMRTTTTSNHRSISTRTTNKCQPRTMPPPAAMRPWCPHSVVQRHRRRWRNRSIGVRQLLLFPVTTCWATSSGGGGGVGKGGNTTRPSHSQRCCLPRLFVLLALWLCVGAGIGDQQVLAAWTKRSSGGSMNDKESVEYSLQTIHDIATENLGSLCVTRTFRPLGISLNTQRYDGARQKCDMAATVLQEVGVNRHGALLDALAKGLLADEYVSSARILASNTTNGILGTSVWWVKQPGSLEGPRRIEEEGLQVGNKPSVNYPWYEDQFTSPGLRSPKFVPSPEHISFRGFWTYPYFSCALRRWIVSYSIAIPPLTRHDVRGYLSIDIDVTELQVNQCNSRPSRTAGMQSSTHPQSSSSSSSSSASMMMVIAEHQSIRQGTAISRDGDAKYAGDDNDANVNGNGIGSAFHQVEAFHGSHKCHAESMQCEFRPPNAVTVAAVTPANASPHAAWTRGAYQCVCRAGFYSQRHPDGFNGTLMEMAYQEWSDNVSAYYADAFTCARCAPGCDTCTDPRPCLATYNWPFRMTLLTISVLCAVMSLALIGYMYRYRKVKVFKVASPKFLTITLIGCAIMYSEMAAIFPILDVYACIVTKWTRHMGFCLTYTALLMKTWRVSLTYRVKSAHKVKLTDKQLLQWMVPILLVMLIYLGTWTLSATPYAEVIMDNHGLKFKLCSYNWWDHSLAIGEVLFLAWGIRVCYNVRNAESLYNEARMISYAIYNIALVNIAMIAFHVCILPNAGPDIKYLLGFIRTQLSTSVTVALVFGPKVARVLRGQGDQWDNRARFRGLPTAFVSNGGGGLMQEDAPDPYVENEELKEEVQKLAAQIEFMKIVHMEINNRHLKPKPGGYFTMVSVFQSPQNRATGAASASAQTQHTQTGNSSRQSTHQNSAVSEDGPSGTHSAGASSIGYPSSMSMAMPTAAPPPTLASSVTAASAATVAPSSVASTTGTDRTADADARP